MTILTSTNELMNWYTLIATGNDGQHDQVEKSESAGEITGCKN